MAGIQSVTFIDKDSALETFRRQLKGQISLLDNLKENPLPDAFELHLVPDTRTEGNVEALAKQIESLSVDGHV